MRQKHVPLAHIAKVMVPGKKYDYLHLSALTGIKAKSLSGRVTSMVGEGLISRCKDGKHTNVYATKDQLERMKYKSKLNTDKKGKRNPDKPPAPKITRSSLDILLFSTAIV